jgi:hypothetical protein
MRRLLMLAQSHDDLDDQTADRLLRGLAVDDAPPTCRSTAEVLALVTDAASDAELSDRDRAVDAIATRVRAASGERGVAAVPHRRRRTAQLVAVGTVSGMVLFGSLAAANALPGPAQGVASGVLAHLGVSVPTSDDHPGNGGAGDAGNNDSNGKGSTVSDLARTTPATGVDKGAAISSVASDGKSQAGTHGGGASNDAGTPPASTPPVTTPNPGGTGTADTASDGKSDAGTTTAGTASDGHSEQGSANADSGLSHKP